jgi:hypothetical protein
MNSFLPKRPAGLGSYSDGTGLKYRFLRNLLLNMLLIVIVAGSQTARSQTNAYSANFQSLLNQIQMMYCQPNGYDFNQIRSTYPVTFATILGHALRQQMLQTQRDPRLRPAYDNLYQEARSFFSASFRQYQYHFDNGQPMQEQSLWQFVQNGVDGLNDDMVMRDFRVAQGTMPMVLATDAGGAKIEGISVAKTPIDKPKEKNAIILLGVEAPAVKGETPTFFDPNNPAPANSESTFETDKPFPKNPNNGFETNKPFPTSNDNSFELNK